MVGGGGVAICPWVVGGGRVGHGCCITSTTSLFSRQMADPFGFGIPEDFGVAIGEPPRPKEDYPKARAPGLGPKAEERFIEWVEDWLLSLIPAHTEKIAQWREEEKAYRAEPGPPKEIPFVGACNDVVPLIASGVDPVFARLDTGIFKADPVFRVKPLAQRVKRHAEALERFINAYQKHQLRLREVSAPRLLELAKHGTCVFKTVFDVERYRIRGYERGTWKVVDREITRYKGPSLRPRPRRGGSCWRVGGAGRAVGRARPPGCWFPVRAVVRIP